MMCQNVDTILSSIVNIVLRERESSFWPPYNFCSSSTLILKPWNRNLRSASQLSKLSVEMEAKDVSMSNSLTWGMSMVPTVIPAMASAFKLSCHLYSFIHFREGTARSSHGIHDMFFRDESLEEGSTVALLWEMGSTFTTLVVLSLPNPLPCGEPPLSELCIVSAGNKSIESNPIKLAATWAMVIKERESRVS